ILKQDLSMLTEGLNFQASFSYDASNTSLQSRHKMSSYYAINGTNDDGLYVLSTVREGDTYLAYGTRYSANKSDELKAQLNYDRVFNATHRVGAMLMYYQRNYVNPIASSSTNALPYRKQGIAFRATYSYNDRYFAEINAGYNGSENFARGHRMGLFPAAAVGYLISSEPWWNIDVINHLKLRASAGLVGSDNTSRFAYLSTWGSGNGGHRFGNGVWNNGLGEDEVGVSDLTWEKGFKKDVGLEIKMFNSRLSLDFDYFHDYRYDILIRRSSIPAVAGLLKNPYANMGIMTNQGLEITGDYNGKIGKDFGYRIYGNFSYAHNNIVFKDEAQTDPWRMATGHRYGQKFGYIALGLFTDQEDIDNSPDQSALGGQIRVGDVKYKDINEDGVIDVHDQTAIGFSTIPEINYGFGAQITWKGFDFGVFFRGQANVSYGLGGTFFPFYQGVGEYNLFACAVDRAQVAEDEWGDEVLINPDAFYPRLSASRNTNNTVMSTRTIYDGSLLRLSDLELGYTFKGNALQTIGCSQARVYLVGTNLLLFSPFKMWDPETGSTNGSSYPLQKKINIGVRLTF
ncbi:MAG: SusC/RagA family TonB-linked outer membrane protein, partial [Bacteroidales bacterium]|nr:SusC/RagA family TonB-linked outer membrane protein [Bacteroidales bacterium]